VAHRDHAAELVAVGQAVDHHVRARLAGLEAVHVVDAGVAGAIGGEVAGRDLDRGQGRAHAPIVRGRRPLSAVADLEVVAAAAVAAADEPERPVREVDRDAGLAFGRPQVALEDRGRRHVAQRHAGAALVERFAFAPWIM
jgi:hypothetical protein